MIISHSNQLVLGAWFVDTVMKAVQHFALLVAAG